MLEDGVQDFNSLAFRGVYWPLTSGILNCPLGTRIDELLNDLNRGSSIGSMMQRSE
jgi:hypothetical protein